jgi:hypothetical protein
MGVKYGVLSIHSPLNLEKVLILLIWNKFTPKLNSEKMHQKFSKYILGVHKKATNLAVLSELGRHSLYFNIVKSMLSYYLRLEKTGSTFPLLNDAYRMKIITYHNDNTKKSSWYSSIKFVLDKVSSLLNVDSSKINGERLKDFFAKDWQKKTKRK